MQQFVHLHVHTQYSLLDGAAKVEELFEHCKSKNMPAVALTDHGVMYGVIDFYRRAKDAGIKPIIGCEFYITRDMHDKAGKSELDHLVLLAKDYRGYQNLVKMDSLAFVEGFYYKPRIDLQLLKKHSEGVVCLSACLAGTVPRMLLANDYLKAKQTAEIYRDIFAPGDYYIELQDHGLKEQKYINPQLIRIAKEIGVKVVATNDVHYLSKSDATVQDVLMCVQMNKTLDDPNRLKFETDEFYLKDYDEMHELFGSVPEALSSTLEIAEKCNVDIKFKMPLIPNYVPENGMCPREFLQTLTMDGLKKRYGDITPEAKERAEYELKIIDSMGFNEYYLIVWDFINYALSQNIPVGAGRGSGVGSIVAYAVGITNVDPLKYNLLFERFLNPERMSMPDFDIDFCVDGRAQVIDYVVEKYGAEKVTQIVTFGTLAAKAAIKDVARAFRVPYSEVDKVTKLIPSGNVSLKKLFNPGDGDIHIPELLQIYNDDQNMRQVIEMAMKLEGMPRNTSMHAAGVVICKEVISDYVPLQRNGEDITTQFNMIEVEKLGLLKMDFLGLRTLTDIDKAIAYAKEQHGITIDFEKMGYEDKGVYELIGEGDTDAVFQLESAGMKRFMRELKPASLEDVIAGISLYRPGPMDSIPKYVYGKNNPDKVTYKHPLLQEFLEVTYGCIVYQEQVMQIVQRLAGFSLGQADIIRRAMGKKDAVEMAKQKDIFLNGDTDEDGNIRIEGALRRGIPEDVAIDIFDEMEGFARYAFNKSHAAAYAVIAYQTAYLKRYYRVEFITAVLNNRITKIEEITKYVNYCRMCNIKILPPDVNRSRTYFAVEDKAIRFGLAAIKNCGENAVNMIIRERERGGEFCSLTDFLTRIEINLINKRLMESFIYAGAFDCFGATRSQLMRAYEGIMDRVVSDRKKTALGQFSMFEGLIEDTCANDEFDDVPEYPDRLKLTSEKEVLGVYVTGHPLDEYRHIFENCNFDTSMLHAADEDDLHMHEDSPMEGGALRLTDQSIRNEMRINTAGLLSGVKKIFTKAGKEMAAATLEDLYGSVELLFFSQSYSKNKQMLNNDIVVHITGKLSIREDDAPKIIVDSVRPASAPSKDTQGSAHVPAPQRTDSIRAQRVYLRIDSGQKDDIFKTLANYPGSCQVVARLADTGEAVEFPQRVTVSPGLCSELISLLSEENIVIK